MQLLVVLRTCDHSQVHPERGARFIDCTKPELIHRCVKSLLTSIKAAQSCADVRLYVLDDHSSDATVAGLKHMIESNQISYYWETSAHRGFNATALRQFEICKQNAQQLVYCVEDDYLHYPEAITQMIHQYQQFEHVTGSHVAIRPDDDVFVYANNNPHSRKPCIILLGQDRHWRTTHSAHNTLLTHVHVFREYWHLFASLAQYFRRLDVDEDKTINLIWQQVPLFSPIPGLAMHVSQNNPPPFRDYQALWESMQP